MYVTRSSDAIGLESITHDRPTLVNSTMCWKQQICFELVTKSETVKL